AIAFARPKESIGNVLPHTRPKARAQRLPGVFLRFAHGFGNLQTIGERRGNRGGERASRAVITTRQAFPGIRPDHAFRSVQRVDDLRRVLVRSRDQYELAAELENSLRTAGEIGVFLLVAFSLGKPTRFMAVGGQDGSLRQE